MAKSVSPIVVALPKAKEKISSGELEIMAWTCDSSSTPLPHFLRWLITILHPLRRCLLKFMGFAHGSGWSAVVVQTGSKVPKSTAKYMGQGCIMYLKNKIEHRKIKRWQYQE